MTRRFNSLSAAVLLLAALALISACGGDETAGSKSPGATPATNGEAAVDASASATGGVSGEIEAFVTSSDLSVGTQRFAFVLIRDGVPVSEEDVAVRFFKLKDESNPQMVGEGQIPWSPLGIPGLTASTAELTRRLLREHRVRRAWDLGRRLHDRART
ncbi:MAG: hypothetical protein M5U18_19785 [Dehalococcoidia bacterium]|nr:hypothetical protein [Dehalococcoidia bacterium]